MTSLAHPLPEMDLQHLKASEWVRCAMVQRPREAKTLLESIGDRNW